MKRLELIAEAYWAVGTALRHPTAPSMGCGEALNHLQQMDRLRPEEHKLSENMHVIKYDIIEGNDEWREKREVHGSVSTLPTRP